MSFAVSRRQQPESFMDSTSSGLYRVHEEDDEGISEEATTAAGRQPRLDRGNVDLEEERDDPSFQFKVQQDQSFFERSQNAKRIRRQQLEDWHRREKPTGPGAPELGGLAQSGSLRHRAKNPAAKKRKKTVMFEWNVLLMDAVLRDETLEVDRLLSTYEDLEGAPRTELVNCRSPDGLTPLHQCCIENLEKMARLLIKNGADLRAADSELWTPLHAAATCGHLAMVKLLMEAAKMHKLSTSDSTDIVKDMLLAINSDGNMPFDLCENVQTLSFIEKEMQLRGVTQNDIECKRHKKEVDMLRDLQQYIDCNLKRSGSFRQRSTSLHQSQREMWAKFIAASKMPNSVMMHIAAANGYLEAIDLLVKNKFPVDLEDDDGWLPIHAAVAWNQPEAAKRLVEAGADIMSKVRGTNETALDLAHAADLSQDVGTEEKFRDQLIFWDTAYKTMCAEEAKKAKPENEGRHASSESITSAPSSSSPLLRRTSPKMLRVQRRSSLKDKEDLIALLHTLGAHDLHSSEKNQGSLGKFARSPGGSLRERNPSLPNVPEEAVVSSSMVHIGDGDADLIDQTISPELLSSLLRSFDEDGREDEDSEGVAEQFLRDAAESLNQIDQPVTLAQLKHRRNRFRLLKRKEKPFTTRELAKESLQETLLEADAEVSCLPVSSSSKLQVVTTQRSNAGIVDSTELHKYKQPLDEGPVGSAGHTSPKLLHFAKKKKDKIYNIPSFRPGGGKRDKEPLSDDSLKARNISSNGCCLIA